MRANDWVPRTVSVRVNNITQAQRELSLQLQRKPNLHDLAEFFEISPEKMQVMYQKSEVKQISSLDAEIQTDQHVEDSISDDRPDPFAHFQQMLAQQNIRAVIEELAPIEKQVVMLYYYQDKTFAEIADLFGVTQSRVSQIHSQLKKNIWLAARRNRLDF